MARQKTDKEIDEMLSLEKIIEHDFSSEMKKSYLAYSVMSIVDRALPDIRDGMKPVQRRINYSMYDQHIFPEGNFKKSARIVGDVIGKYHPHGDCLRADTKVYLANGTIKTMKELYDIGETQEIITIDTFTGEPKHAYAHTFKIGQYADNVYHIKLSNGQEICCTNNHPLLNNSLEWIAAENIKIGDKLYSMSITKKESEHITVNVPYNNYHNSLHQLVYNTYDSYNTKSNIIHHKNKNKHDNSKDNLQCLTKGEHAKLHGDYLVGLKNGRESMKNDPMLMEKNKQKNSFLFKEFNKNQGINRAIKLIRDMNNEGIDLTEDNYNLYKKNYYNYPNIDKLIEKGKICNFTELVEKALDKTFKFIEFDPNKAYDNIDEENIETYMPKEKYKFPCRKVFKLFFEMIDLDINLTDENYEEYRINKCKSLSNIQDRDYPTLETINKYTSFECLLNTFNNLFPIVVDIEIEKTDKEPMYDFTVDGHHNMMVITNIEDNNIYLICAHNTGTYGALTNMANDFDTRYPLVWGHGNFGSADGDGAAAMRYTEAKLQKIALENLKEIADNGVPMQLNFSEDEYEPEVLPGLLPNLLINGCDGIATGYTTTIPSHNLNEVCDGIIATVKNPDISVMELIENYIKGPDLPSGGYLIEDENILDLYTNGVGKIKFRGNITTDINEENGNRQIVIDELPPDLKKSSFVEKLYQTYVLNKDKKVIDIRDESEGNGVRIVLELHKTAIPELLIKDLYENTNITKTKSYILRAIVDQTPMLLNLKEIIEYYIEHRRNVIERKTKFKKEKLEKKLNSLEGFNKIINSLEDVALLIARSDSPKDAAEKLIKTYSLNKEQADSILEKKLSSLTRLEKDKIAKEIKDLQKQVAECEDILSNAKSLNKEIIKEMKYLKNTYGDPRKTKLLKLEEEQTIIQQNVVSDEPMFVTLTNKNKIKTMPYTTFTTMLKNKSFKEKNNIFVQGLKCNMSDSFIIIYNNGEYLKCDFADLSIELNNNTITAILPYSDDNENVIVLMSKNGMIKKIKVNLFKAKNLKLTSVIQLEEGDELIGVRAVEDNDTNIVTLATNNGIVHRFYLRGFGATSQSAKPLGCINMDDDDNVVDFDITDINADNDSKILIYSKHESGNSSLKAINLSEFIPKNRMAKGAKAISYYKKDLGFVTNIILASQNDILVLNNGDVVLNKIDDIQVTDKASKPTEIGYEIAISKFVL